MTKFYFSKEHNEVVYKNLTKYQDLIQLEPNTVDAAKEKHVPVVEINGETVKVKVGEVAHPMLDVHYIMMIALETNQGLYVEKLEPNMAPVATFVLKNGEDVLHAYEYCNLHGLWMK